MKSLYLLVDLFTILIPFLFSFHPKIRFYKRWKSFFPAAIIVAIIFIIWDSVFTQLGVWNFNPRYVTGTYFLNLPIEEILFFICIPYSCVFTFYCLNQFYDLSWNVQQERIFCILLSIILLVTGLIFINQIYTSVTFITTALVCLFLKFVVKINWFGKAVSVYAILLVPFLIVNGILTGTGLQEAVVQYNNSQNLNLRFITIPVEDIVYGFEIIMLNLYLFKIFETSFAKRELKMAA